MLDSTIAWIFVAVVLLLFAWNAIRVVPEYQRMVVLRLGRSIGQKGPGIVWVIPFVDKIVRVDLREMFLDIPKQTCITRDNAPINIDFLVYWKVVDPVASVLNVQDFAGSSQGIATTTLRAVVGDIPLDDVLAKREQINQVLRAKLDEVTERWGVKVTSVEIREIQPPAEVQTAMNKQMAAERSRRALVLEADGTREAAVKVAEGEKQAAILKAEGDRQALILRAEADRQAAILRAEGFSLGLQTVFQVAQNLDPKTMGLQYLDALRALGQSPATKIVFPLELTSLLRPFAAGLGDGGGAAKP
jgi:regulator of protease activity HflC (stomatin/prohibitin superfamily)